MHKGLGPVGRVWLATTVVGLVGSISGCNCGSKLGMAIAGPTKPVRADGVTPALLTFTVTQDGKPVPDANLGQIKVSTDLGQVNTPFDASNPSAIDDPGLQSTTVPLSSGSAKVQVFSAHTGTANITANYSDQYGTALTQKTTISFGSASSSTVASVKFVSADPPSINLAGSGGVTASTVTFKLLDASNSPVSDGVPVTFALSSNAGGATITPTSGQTAHGDGTVQTVLNAGTVAATVTVTATTSGMTQSSETISIAGAGVNYRTLTFICDHTSIGGLQWGDLTNNCKIYSSDSNKQLIPGTRFNFLAEAGSVTGDIVAVKDDTTGLVEANFKYQSTCPLPKDVDPNPGEFAANNCNFFDRCAGSQGTTENRTCNQRDGYANMIIYTTGQECFKDVNGNGRYDENAGEFDPTCDLDEPYVDENDNGQYDQGEPFIDYNNDGVWTPRNGQWDNQWPIWKALTIVWTDSADPAAPINIKNPGRSGGPFVPNEGSLPKCVNQVQNQHTLGVPYADINGNCPAGCQESDNATILASGNASAGNTFQIMDCANVYQPSDGGLPFVYVTATDVNTCDCATLQSCIPPGYSVTLEVMHTVDSDNHHNEDVKIPAFTGQFN